MQFSMPDQWSRQLFMALCRRYGLKPYRYSRQRYTTVMLRAPKEFFWTRCCGRSLRSSTGRCGPI
jgi:hypothetical protein